VCDWISAVSDLGEVNEAFAAQYLAVEQELALDRDRTKVTCGAIALGHPLSATGTRLVLTLLLKLRRRGVDTGWRPPASTEVRGSQLFASECSRVRSRIRFVDSSLDFLLVTPKIGITSEEGTDRLDFHRYPKSRPRFSY
ncbi:MAG TPA: hypothetical protein VHQ95_26295, partial [Pyrinomonadaceae bacterium]|nr:hypothetical protein [Pyrinomonadaceae bacterium]